MDCKYTEPISPEAIARLIAQGKLVNDEENCWTIIGDRTITWSRAQAGRFSKLWGSLQRGNPPMLGRIIMRDYDGATSNLRDLFKNCPEWGTLIVGDGKGRYWLNIDISLLLGEPIAA